MIIYALINDEKKFRKPNLMNTIYKKVRLIQSRII